MYVYSLSYVYPPSPLQVERVLIGFKVDANASQTFTLISPDFNISYSSGASDYVAGVYFKDHFAIGQPDNEAQIFMQMGLALDSSPGFLVSGGILGLGFPGAEATDFKYPTLMEQLVDVGLTNSMLYSLYILMIYTIAVAAYCLEGLTQRNTMARCIRCQSIRTPAETTLF
jgi:hypothetical protein